MSSYDHTQLTHAIVQGYMVLLGTHKKLQGEHKAIIKHVAQQYALQQETNMILAQTTNEMCTVTAKSMQLMDTLSATTTTLARVTRDLATQRKVVRWMALDRCEERVCRLRAEQQLAAFRKSAAMHKPLPPAQVSIPLNVKVSIKKKRTRRRPRRFVPS